MFTSLKLFLFFLILHAHASTWSTDDDYVPNRYTTGTPTTSQLIGAWERISEKGFLNSTQSYLMSVIREEQKEQANAFILAVSAKLNTYVSGQNSLSELVDQILLEKEKSYPDLCSFNKEYLLIQKLNSIFYGAMQASSSASARAADKYRDQNSLAASFGVFSRSTGYDTDAFASAFWNEGMRRGNVYGKKNTYIDEFYVHRIFFSVYNSATLFMAELNSKTNKLCNEDTPFMLQKAGSTQSSNNSEVFLMGLPKKDSKISFPFKTPEDTKVVIAVYDKKSDSYIIKRDELVKIGLLNAPISLTPKLNNVLDKDLYLIPPSN